ncbi:aromatic ring-hydroxylating oxygenase subunit alpha [Ramlibacter sp.]|uniref:aromatic ring-hydroxylating oxygenase subunit alpha n=1 Tax=Ramlibacter sp. TaxID=1917967 RepID=UPI003D0BC9F9
MNPGTPPIVDLAKGLIPRTIYSSQDCFEQERDRVFSRSWMYVGHESQLPQKGDFFVSQCGHEPVLVTRDMTGAVNVMLNHCPHRGVKVCRYDHGNAQRFTCPYHFWSFGSDGKLVGIPKEECYEGKLDASQWGLMKARVALFGGSIWATFGADVPAFEDYLGDAAFTLRDFWAGPDGEDDGWEIVEGVQKWDLPCNWKFPVENAAGDLYHDPSHASVQRLGIAMSGKKGRHAWDADPAKFRTLNLGYPGSGHACRASLYDDEKRAYVSMWGQDPVVDEYFRDAHYERQRRLGERSRFYNRGGAIFPNMTYLAAGRTAVTIFVPRAPGMSEVWRWYFVPRKAPQAVKDALRHYLLRYAGPAGMTETDDIENWTGAQLGTASHAAASNPFNFMLQLDKAKPAWPVPWFGETSLCDEGISDNGQRCFYARWNTAMTEPVRAANARVIALKEIA